MLSDQDLMNVQAMTERISSAVTIYVNEGAADDHFGTNLANIARQISGVSLNRVKVEFGEALSPFPDKPCLTLAGEFSQNIHYFAAPEGHELQPFLEALAWLGGAQQPRGSDAVRGVKEISSPVDLLILIAAVCPHCPQAVRLGLSMAARQPLIQLSVVDAIEFGDLAARYKVKSTPTTIVNNGLTLVGTINESELVEGLLESEAESSLTRVVDSMIKSGRAEDAGRLICEKNAAGAILPLYVSKEFSTRMGALVAIDEALALNARIMDSVVEDLVPLLFQEDVALRGDTAELLGKIGDPAAEPALKKAAHDGDADVREAAEEALGLLGSKQV
ncbi:MAG: thioredoxin family protein [Desulfomonile tiedjei]|uniref:Thioredoxin family protein n=1 Tax=Desulfomonile tiedjei TaxID=2358 RepID=A0A9D6Z2X2_9BACT|nr:thioredoxin family protein [Desulfomonile tiedjei]